MSLMTRCVNNKCNNKEYCYRQEYDAGKKQYSQSSACFAVINDSCAFFVPNEKYKTFQILATN